jgi:hypothetical protein
VVSCRWSVFSGELIGVGLIYFDGVAWNRDRTASDLACQSVKLMLRESRGSAVNQFTKINRLLPSDKVPIGCGSHNIYEIRYEASTVQSKSTNSERKAFDFAASASSADN